MEVEVTNVARPKVGLVDGPETLLRCSLCNKALLTIWVVQPEIEVEWDVVAECPCGDESESLHIKGKFKHAPADGVFVNDILTTDKIIYVMGKQND